MFRDSGGALTRQLSQDNELDGPYPCTTNKLEQVENTRSQQFSDGTLLFSFIFIILLDNERAKTNVLGLVD